MITNNPAYTPTSTDLTAKENESKVSMNDNIAYSQHGEKSNTQHTLISVTIPMEMNECYANSITVSDNAAYGSHDAKANIAMEMNECYESIGENVAYESHETNTSIAMEMNECYANMEMNECYANSIPVDDNAAYEMHDGVENDSADNMISSLENSAPTARITDNSDANTSSEDYS